jgi:hypothetical protein
MNILITIALLASLMLAGSCNSSQPDSQVTVNQSMITTPQIVNDSIESRSMTDDSLPALPDPEDEMFSPNTLIISYDTEVGTAHLDKAIEACGAEVIYRYNNIHAVAIRLPGGKDIHQAIDHFNQVKGVIAVNRDRKMRLMKHGKPQ